MLRIVTSSTLKGKWQESARSESCVCAKNKQRCVQKTRMIFFFLISRDWAVFKIFSEKMPRKARASVRFWCLLEGRKWREINASSRTESNETEWMSSRMKRSETDRNHPRIEETTSVRKEKSRQSLVREVNRVLKEARRVIRPSASRLAIRSSWDTVSLIGNYRAKASLIRQRMKTVRVLTASTNWSCNSKQLRLRE